MTEKKHHVGKEVIKSMTGIGIGLGLAKLAAKTSGGLLGGVLSTASNIFFSSGAIKGASTITDALVEKVLGKDEMKCRIQVREAEEEK